MECVLSDLVFIDPRPGRPARRPSLRARVSGVFSLASSGLVSLTKMVFRRSAYRVFKLGSSNVDYLSKVGDGTGSSTVTAPVYWAARTFPEAPPAIWQELDDGQEERVLRHDMLTLLQRPNRFYTGMILWMATVIEHMVDGNAYWIKMRDGFGRPAELWWTPHWMISPKSDSDSEFISYYEYGFGTQRYELPPEEVVHFRFGMDPDDPKLGMSPLKSVLREVYTDDEAAAFTASLLANMGVPGLIVSPEKGVTVSEPEAKETKATLMEKFSGDRRGEPMVMTGATQVSQFGFSPEQLLLREIRRVPEERVTAVTGIPAIVAGLGAGLDRSTFTNMNEAREAAYEHGIIPMQRLLAEDVRFQLLVDFERDVIPFRFGFDLSKVRVLQEDLFRQAQRHDLAIRGGWEQVAEGRRAMGLEVDEANDHVYLRPANVVEVPADGSQPRALAPKSLNGNGSANGHLSATEVADELERRLDRRELTTA